MAEYVLGLERQMTAMTPHKEWVAAACGARSGGLWFLKSRGGGATVARRNALRRCEVAQATIANTAIYIL